LLQMCMELLSSEVGRQLSDSDITQHGKLVTL
jgi:hypothetical protein